MLQKRGAASLDEAAGGTKSNLMARVRSKDTAPELAVRRELYRRGFRYRLHRRDLPGRPDMVLPRHRLAMFIHGCFWHGCPACDRGMRRPKSNVDFWEAKLAENRARDARNIAALEELGWRVAVIWECVIRSETRLAEAIDGLPLDARIYAP
ncbi:very short patch repair endonuclease [Inquilinus ginsengisoli]|uniref:very short patch repair endonuclease n=1 Tax=Inquilinus ginsengisoli TaxID=363840 RepID=UPI00286B09E9|nr:very short patch repair endonuclease [Inquilinus ginsengisoli]